MKSLRDLLCTVLARIQGIQACHLIAPACKRRRGQEFCLAQIASLSDALECSAAPHAGRQRMQPWPRSRTSGVQWNISKEDPTETRRGVVLDTPPSCGKLLYSTHVRAGSLLGRTNGSSGGSSISPGSLQLPRCLGLGRAWKPSKNASGFSGEYLGTAHQIKIS